MSFNELDQSIEKLHFKAVKTYLKNTGWNHVHPEIENIMLFERMDDEMTQLVLPMNKDFADYHERNKDMVVNLAKFENRPPHQVLTDLLTDPADIIRFRVINNNTSSGTISLKDGFDLIKSARDMIYTAACDVIQPEYYHKRLGFKTADLFISNCRLGQTEHGSFVASVICPFADNDSDDFIQTSPFSLIEEYDITFTRQVTRKLVNSLNTIKKAIENDQTDILFNKIPLVDKYMMFEKNEPISGNFVESLLALNESAEETDVVISVSSSPNAPAADFGPKSQIRFNKGHRSGLEYIARRLKPASQITLEDIFVSRISETKAEADLNSRNEGEVLLSFLDVNEKPVKAWVKLDKNQYNIALDAHRKGQQIRLKGILHSTRRSHTITNVSDFKLLD